MPSAPARRVIGALIGVILLAVALWVIHHELGQHSIREVIQDLRALPPARLGLCLLATLLSYAALSAHDLLASSALGLHLPARKAALAGFAGFAFANSLPFAVLAGGAVRARFYAGSRLSTGSTTTLVLFNTVTYALGLLAAGGLALTLKPRTIPGLLHLPFHSTRPLGLFAMALLGLFLLWSARGAPTLRIGKRTLRPTPLGVSLARLGISLLDWSFSAAALFVLLPGSEAFGFSGFLGAFMLGQIAALVAQLPGGLGVFEAVMTRTLGRTIPVTQVLGALVAYRVLYFLLPLVVAAVMLAAREVRHPGKRAKH
jgi:uncharacterized membrane protein YbhN (UPF0104 family)